ncbi:MAG TPA: hypothetical protein VFP61_15300, partial [Acidimicrobiales bacterium]|nr:hypothetical protein [Acidimicrobiales bacterium]
MAPAPLRRRVPLGGPLDLRRTLGPLRRGRRDRCTVVDGATVWRATRTPAGPVSVRLEVDPRVAELTGSAWGPGAAWAVEHLAAMAGADDDDTGFAEQLAGARGPGASLLAALRRQLPGLRIPATGAVTEALVPAVLEQKVTGLQAHRSWVALVAQLGTPAPGPAGALGMLVPPAPEVWAQVPSWTFHRAGVERKRAATIATACGLADRLDPPAPPPPPGRAGRRAASDVARRLAALPGVGAWTVAEVSRVALGDPDAVSVGDYHLKNTVVWNLAGRARGTDEEMLELLEPYRGHRGRVTRLLEAAGRF